MSLLRTTLLTAKCLARALGPWPFLFLLVWTLVIKIQEPDFFAVQRVPFFWQSQRAILLLAAGLLPLAWRLAQGADAAVWTVQTSRSALWPTLAGWLGVSLYGTFLLVIACAWAQFADLFPVFRISAPFVAWPSLQVLVGALGFLVLTASLAPGLALLSWSTPTLVFLWLLVLAAALHLFGPGDFSEAASTGTGFSGILSGLLATLGGLFVSLAQTFHRLRH